MRNEPDLQKREALFWRRVAFDIPKKMSEIRQLRERVRSAELAAMHKQNADRPERQAPTRSERYKTRINRQHRHQA